MDHRGLPDALGKVDEPDAVVDRDGLRLEGESDLRVHDEGAVRVERVAAHPVRHVVEVPVGERELVLQEGGQVGRREVAPQDALVAAARGQVVLAHGHLQQRRRHRLALDVRPGRAIAVRPLRPEHAVGDCHDVARGVDPEAVARLVARMVVGREDQVREVRLRRRGGAVGRDEERRRREVRRVGLGRHRHEVGHDHHE